MILFKNMHTNKINLISMSKAINNIYRSRGYYIAVQRYEITLQVLKNTRTSEIFFNTRREILYLQAAM